MTETSTQAAPAPLQVRVTDEMVEAGLAAAERACCEAVFGDPDYGFASAFTDDFRTRFRRMHRAALKAALDLSTPTQIAALEAENVKLRAERDEARAANERDRTEVCMAVNSLTDAFSRRDWLLRGGRGSYEWDDDRFRTEFGDAMAEFKPHVDRLRKIGADRSNCPETQVEVIVARAPPARAERAEAEVARLTEALKPFAEIHPATIGGIVAALASRVLANKGKRSERECVYDKTAFEGIADAFRRARATLAAMKGSTDGTRPAGGADENH